MIPWIIAGVIALILLWLLGVGRRRAIVPEAEQAPAANAELEAAERAIKDDPDAKPAADAVDDDDNDWGPGSTGSPHSPVPGVLP